MMKKPKIKNIPYEEFKDNETFEQLVAELNQNGYESIPISRKYQDVIMKLL